MQQQNIDKAQQITNLAAQIKGFNFDISIVEVSFSTDVYNKDQIQNMLNAIGIDKIIYSNYDKIGYKSSIKTTGCSFVLNYSNVSNQKGLIDDLKYRFVRIKALKDLYKHSGLQATQEEIHALKQYVYQ